MEHNTKLSLISICLHLLHLTELVSKDTVYHFLCTCLLNKRSKWVLQVLHLRPWQHWILKQSQSEGDSACFLQYFSFCLSFSYIFNGGKWPMQWPMQLICINKMHKRWKREKEINILLQKPVMKMVKIMVIDKTWAQMDHLWLNGSPASVCVSILTLQFALIQTTNSPERVIKRSWTSEINAGLSKKNTLHHCQERRRTTRRRNNISLITTEEEEKRKFKRWDRKFIYKESEAGMKERGLKTGGFIST